MEESVFTRLRKLVEIMMGNASMQRVPSRENVQTETEVEREKA